MSAAQRARTQSHRTDVYATLASLFPAGWIGALSSGSILHPTSRHVSPFRPGVGVALAAVLGLLLFSTSSAASAATPNFCPSGTAAGRCDDPEAVAVDQASGDVFVGEFNNNRIDEFTSSGTFLRAFGFGVATGSNDFETCSTTCVKGNENLRPVSLAVDNSGGPSAGDIYVFSGNEVQKYALNPITDQAELVRRFGSAGSGPGQFSGEDPITVDSSGHVWVGDEKRVEEFGENGELLAEVTLPEVAGAKSIGALAVDPAGDFYVLNQNPEARFTPGVRRYSSSGALLETLDPTGHPNALALDPASGDLFVSDQLEPNKPANAGPATLLQFDSTGALTESFGSGEVIGAPQGNVLAFGESARRLYVVSSASGENSAAQAFALPQPGPLPVSVFTKEVGKTSATLCAKINPEGASTTAHFQYLTAAAYEADGDSFGTGTLETAESAPLGSDFEPHELCQAVSPLLPATAYRFRVVATNPNAGPGGIDGEAAEFSVLPPAAIDFAGVADVTAESATLEAEVNPLGDATSYRFEILTEARYLANGETFAGAAQVPLAPVAIGSGQADVPVSQHVQGLQGGTAYFFRVVVTNAVSEANGGPFAGPTHAFTTQVPAASGLPDGRAWEQVSPVDKRDGRITGIGENELVQASASGDAITYLSSSPVEADPQGAPGTTPVLSGRAAGGWSSIGLASPHESALGLTASSEYRFFSEELTSALMLPRNAPVLSPAASQPTPFLRATSSPGTPTSFCTTSCYRPLVTGCPAVAECPPAVAAAANVPAGTEFGNREFEPEFLGATPDLSHIVLGSKAPLVTGAPSRGLYVWSDAEAPSRQLRLVSIMPDGTPVTGATFGLESSAAAQFSREAISSDGSRVLFSQAGHLYLRLDATAEPSASGECSGSEPAKACTVQLDTVEAGAPGGGQSPEAELQTASVDDSRIFFTDTQQLTPRSGTALGAGDLYEYDLERPLGERLADLTPETDGEVAAVQGSLPGASEDGSYLYFVANGVLGDGVSRGAKPGDCRLNGPDGSGECNLYVAHQGSLHFIATLAGQDYPSWDGRRRGLNGLTSRVSANGRWLAFMSERSLTGYDNTDTVSGEPDEEVYLYHAGVGQGEEGRLVCASCNPSGARPHGVRYEEDGNENLRLAGGDRVWVGTQWLAANIPGWTPYELNRASHQSRYLSDAGRLFFNSSDALVPADTNGAEDIYEYEPPATAEEAPPGDSCTTTSSTYSPASQGCVNLISSGASKAESAFLDASENGSDVFFLTSAQLAPTDTDTSLDVYDARVGGGFPQATRPVECSGDACQQPATPPAETTPGSLTFSGAGNVVECPKGKQLKQAKCVTAKHEETRQHKKKHHKKKSSTKGKHKRANSKGGGHK